MSQPFSLLRRRPILAVAIAGLIVVVAAVAVQTIVRDDDPTVASTVGHSGFHIELDGIRISAGPGVAPIGTSVRVSPADVVVPRAYDGVATPAGHGIRILLGRGYQPRSPITVAFPAKPSANAVLAERDGGAEVADNVRRSGDSIIVTSNHLSWFLPVFFDVGGWLRGLARQASVALQIGTERPGCFGRATRIGASTWAFSAVPEQVAWPCVATTRRRGVQASVLSNSGLVWTTGARPAAEPEYPVVSDPLGADGLVTAAGLQTVNRSVESVLTPAAKVTYDVSDVTRPTDFTFELNPPLSVVWSVVRVLAVFTPAKVIEELGKAQCFADILAAVAEQSTAKIVGSILGCVGGLVGGILGKALSALTAVPAALISIIDGAVRSATNRGTFTIRLGPKAHGSSCPPSGSPLATSTTPNLTDHVSEPTKTFCEVFPGDSSPGGTAPHPTDRTPQPTRSFDEVFPGETTGRRT